MANRVGFREDSVRLGSDQPTDCIRWRYPRKGKQPNVQFAEVSPAGVAHHSHSVGPQWLEDNLAFVGDGPCATLAGEVEMCRVLA